MKDHEMFLCDERVVGLMPGLLGKIFYEAKK
jgi:ribosome biogenesis protein UTP30